MQLPDFTFVVEGCTTTCMVITPHGSSPKGVLHWPTVLLLSKIFPALISFMSLAPLGAIFLSDITEQKVPMLDDKTQKHIKDMRRPKRKDKYNIYLQQPCHFCFHTQQNTINYTRNTL